MKIKGLVEITEGNIADFGAAKERQQVRRRFDDRQDRRKSDEAKKSEMFGQLDHAIAATIDSLVAKGMDQDTAESAVTKHLNDFIMMYDGEKNGF